MPRKKTNRILKAQSASDVEVDRSRAALASQLQNVGFTFDGQLDTFALFGFPRTINVDSFLGEFYRGGISKRIIEAYPEACWCQCPRVTDDEDNEEESPFETAFNELAKRINLWALMRRWDTLQRIGNYSVLYLGLMGQKVLERPAGQVGEAMLAYVMPMWQGRLTVHKWQEDMTNPEFGMPEIYRIRVGDPQQWKLSYNSWEGARQSEETMLVHASRMVHAAEGVFDGAFYGTPALEPVWNLIQSLHKVTHGSAEVYRLNGQGLLNLAVNKDVNTLSESDRDIAKKQIEDMQLNRAKFAVTQGAELKPIQFSTASQKDLMDSLISLIAGTVGIPQRILTGSEMGSLASTQDRSNWLDRVEERRGGLCEKMVRSVVDKFIELGMLTPQGEEYQVVWPPMAEASADEQAKTAEMRMSAVGSYLSNGGHQLMPPKQFMEDVLGIPFMEEEVSKILDEEEARIEEDDRALDEEESGEETEESAGKGEEKGGAVQKGKRKPSRMGIGT